jgi:hypothetical protein
VSTELLDAVQNDLIPALPWATTVLDHLESPSFGNALVTLRIGDLPVRIARDKLQVLVDFGSSARPGLWFDDNVVDEYLGLGTNAGFHSTDVRVSMQALSRFLITFWDELNAMFNAAEVDRTTNALKTLQEARAVRLLGQ